MRKIRKLLGTAGKTQRIAAYTPAAAFSSPAPGTRGRRKSRKVTRIQSRQKMKTGALSLLRLAPYALLALAAAGLPLAGYKAYMYFITSPHFALTTVNINQTSRIGRQEIIAAAGLTMGDNLLRIDTETAEVGIARLQWVNGVEVVKDYPATVNITVRERTPAALLVDEATWLVDESGNVFKKMEREEYDPSLLTLAGIRAARLVSVQDGEMFREQVREALAVARTYEALGLPAYYKLASVDHDEVLGFTLVSKGRQRFVLGHGQFADKLHRLKTVLDDLASREASVETVRLDNEKQPWKVAVAGTNVRLDSGPAPANVPALQNELLP